MPTKRRPKIEVYLTEEYKQRLEKAMAKVLADGVDLADEKRPGNISRSKLIRYWIDKELADEDRTAPRQQPAPEWALKPTG